MLREIGFRHVAGDDLTTDWVGILEERIAMYLKLREETPSLKTPSGDFYRSYARLIVLVKERTLGGGGFTAQA